MLQGKMVEMNRHNLLRFEELETRQMLSADALIAAAPIVWGIANQSDSLIATSNSPIATLRGVNKEAAEALAQRIREGVAEAVETLTPVSIDVVFASIADDPIVLILPFQSPEELRLTFDAASPDIDSLASRLSRLSQIVTERGNTTLIPRMVRSSLQEGFPVALSRAIDGLRELLSRSELSNALILTGKTTTMTLANNGHTTIQEKPLKSRADQLESVSKPIMTINQFPLDLTAAQQCLRLEAQMVPEISTTIPLRQSEPAAASEGNNSEQISAMQHQREHVSINHWIREISSKPAENVVHALIELHVCLGNPLGDFGTVAGITEFEFDSLMQADGPITDVRGRWLGGLTLLATAMILVGHVKRTGRRGNQVTNEKQVFKMDDSRDVNAFDETVRCEMPRLKYGTPS